MAEQKSEDQTKILTDLLGRFPWLLPVLFMMGGGTIGIGGFEIMLADKFKTECECDCEALQKEVETLERIVRKSLLTETD